MVHFSFTINSIKSKHTLSSSSSASTSFSDMSDVSSMITSSVLNVTQVFFTGLCVSDCVSASDKEQVTQHQNINLRSTAALTSLVKHVS